MLRTLHEEGFEIKERELMRVRAKNRWLLRVPNGTKSASISQSFPEPTAMDLDAGVDEQIDEDLDMEELEQAIRVSRLPAQGWYQVTDFVATQAGNAAATIRDFIDIDVANRGTSPALPPHVQQQRQERREELQAKSEERWAAKKRRRRTRDWAGLPADPPGPPRFPSETTIDESKAFLHLDNDAYRQMRDQFQAICEEAGFTKKTAAGPEKWQAAKDRLIAENAHLNREFYGVIDGVPTESKSLALDVVCTDVTKRMRTSESRMTIAEAKNILGVNPAESRLVRNEFYAILKADNFTSKLEAGPEHWEELKRQWIDASAILQRTPPPTAETHDANAAERLKAMEVLCRDVMKRLRDDTVRKDPSRKKKPSAGPGPGPARPRVAAASMPSYAPTAAMLPPDAPCATTPQHILDDADDDADSASLQIDPSLLAATQLQDPGMSAMAQLQHYASQGDSYPHAPPYSPSPATATAPAPQMIPVAFLLSPASPLQSPPATWSSMLISCTLAELRQCASGQHTHAVVARLEGLIPEMAGSDADAQESLFVVDRDEDLMAYLAFVGAAKPTFHVHLHPGFT